MTGDVIHASQKKCHLDLQDYANLVYSTDIDVIQKSPLGML
jgi:hypothetical protein